MPVPAAAAGFVRFFQFVHASSSSSHASSVKDESEPEEDGKPRIVQQPAFQLEQQRFRGEEGDSTINDQSWTACSASWIKTPEPSASRLHRLGGKEGGPMPEQQDHAVSRPAPAM